MQKINNNALIIAIEKYFMTFFFCTSIFVLIFSTQALLLTWLNQFKILYLSFSIFISFLLTVIFFYFIKKDIKILPHLCTPVLVIIFSICLVFILFPHDTFGGRDEGLYTNLAVYLTNHGNLNTPLYLNPNPAFIEPWTGRVPAYITWLAIQNIFFGQNWMLGSSTILVALGLICLYLVASFLGGRKVGLTTLILYTSCLPFLWLARETLSENMAFFLLWFLVLFFILFFKTKRNIYLGILFIIGWLFSFTRVEGQFIQIPLLLVLISTILITKTASFIKTFFIALIYLFFIASTFLIYNQISSKSFTRTNVSSVGNLVTKSFSSLSVQPSKQNIDIKLINKLPIFFMQMLAKYDLLLILFSIFLVIPIIVTDKKRDLKNKIYFIGLLIIISPEFIKFINPSISLDQPWFYRRYIYALIPFGYFCLSILLNNIAKRKLFIIVNALFIINIALSYKIITLKNNWSLTKAIETIAKNISPNDLVIIKDRYILNYYYPTIYLSYQKEIRSFSSDYIETNNWLPKEKIFEGLPYKRLYLLSDKESESYKDFELFKIDSVEVEYKQLQFNCDLALLQKDLERRYRENLFLPYQDVISYCNKTDNEILNVKKKIFLYELIYERSKSLSFTKNPDF